MNATPELRWVEREVKTFAGHRITENRINTIYSTEVVKVLQQKWVKMVYNDYGVAHATDVFEWHDVPTEKEA